MKRRLVKKWIKRYLHPLLKDLPIVDTYQVIELEPVNDMYGYQRVYSGVSIYNGYVVPEGQIIPQSTGLRRDIIRARDTLQHLMANSRKTFIRVYPKYRKPWLYMRVLVEKQPQ